MPGTSPRIDLIEGNATIAGALASAAGVTTLVSPTKISVPFTAIQNRASIPDLANDAGVSFGVNRIPVQSIYQLQDEIGPNGERVWGVVNDDLNRIRFVGNWGGVSINAFGTLIQSSYNLTDYVEICFYGTGLNLLGYANTSSYNYVAQVDGGWGGIPGAESSNLASSSWSNVLTGATGRGYNPNQVIPVISNLSLGIHTVRIRNNTASLGMAFNGFEILNTSSTTALTVKPGSAIGSQKNTLSALTTTPYNSGFESGSLGSKGGRVLVYLKSDGTIGKAVTPTNASSLTWTSTNHTNEEIIRTYSPREFGAGRPDDFSTVTNSFSSARAFTLDDGTTTLTATAPNMGNSTPEGLFTNSSNSITFTFVGTGLDVLTAGSTGGTNSWASIQIDGGASIASFSQAGAFDSVNQKICSGLPYGTHTVRWNVAAASQSPTIIAFRVYGPKKPSLPSGSVELADYNVMADNTVIGSSGGISPGAGLLAKSSCREFLFSGTGWGYSVSNTTNMYGNDNNTNVQGDFLEYTFFGTGIELTARHTAGTQPITVAIDGSNYTGSATVTGGSWNPVSSQWQNVPNTPHLLRIAGLTLGIHKVKFTYSGTTGNMVFAGIGIITPIHSPKSNLLGDLQNTLPVGSQSLSDSRKFSTSQLQPQKAWAQAVGVTPAPTTTSAAMIPTPDLSLTLKTQGGPIEIFYSAIVRSSVVGQGVYTQIYFNGQALGSPRTFNAPISNYYFAVADSLIVPAAAGVHKIDLYWRSENISSTATIGERNIKAREI